ncbi:MAG: hypothetical protein S4CHLAM123_10820 [Chlamydiales bacterium]|nr:hypothetical protein [Chlamydiales bacterium]
MAIQEFRFAFPEQRLGEWVCNKNEDTMLVSAGTIYNFTVHPIEQGVVNSEVSLTCKTNGSYAIFQRLLKTKSTSEGINLRDCILTRRTHSFKDLTLDTLAPNTRKAIHFEKSRTYLITCVVLDLLTLLFRCITCLPRIAYNTSYPHPLKGEFGENINSVFVQCKKTVEIQGHFLKRDAIEEPLKIETHVSTNYQWPVHFVNPLDTTFEHLEEPYPFKTEKGTPQFILDETASMELDTFCKTALYNETLGILGDLRRERNGQEELLSDLLKKNIATPPIVSFV